MEERIPWNKGQHGMQVAWNKGLTKETDERIADYAEKISMVKKIPNAILLSKKKKIEELYINQHLPYDILLKKIDLSQTGFYYWRTKCGIPSRQKLPISKNELCKLYLDEKLSFRTISTKTGIPKTTIEYWVRKYAIPTRPQSLSRIGKFHTEDAKKKMGIINKGRPSWCKGLHFSDTYRQKISEGKLQFHCDKQTLHNLYWNQRLTLNEIAKKYNINRQTVLNRMNYLGIPRRSHSETLIGENHWNWRGGTVPVRGQWWQQIRWQALQRDNFECQICGRKTSLLVHHILPYRRYKNSEIDKLITLCRSCHSKIENTKRKNNENFIDTSTD